jgi:hypothetical protein
MSSRAEGVFYANAKKEYPAALPSRKRLCPVVELGLLEIGITPECETIFRKKQGRALRAYEPRMGRSVRLLRYFLK